MPGDIYLLCSDGLSDMLDDEASRSCCRAQNHCRKRPTALIDAANEAGGKDNISVVLVAGAGAGAAPARSWWPFRR